jgi:hypothetical protein
MSNEKKQTSPTPQINIPKIPPVEVGKAKGQVPRMENPPPPPPKKNK